MTITSRENNDRERESTKVILRQQVIIDQKTVEIRRSSFSLNLI